ncbi:hypothetical protein FKW77_007271 [Venturia effusa]|uniref:Uncharacterized protein n=1 Tax=Venturia effusa TaxID=50376 RepID=A0A517LN79_9PEZI|nr:hypothetical protein FKW77_007271 [Venturia effusa]
MKLSSSLILSALVLAVSADKHRLCCCTATTCDGVEKCSKPGTQQIIDDMGGRYIKSSKLWTSTEGAPVEGSDGWASLSIPIFTSNNR